MTALNGHADEILSLEDTTWDLPSVFSVLVFGKEPGWCGLLRKEYPYVEYKRALLGEPYGAVSMIIIGGFDASKTEDYAAMARDIQVSLPNTHLLVDPDRMPVGFTQTVSTLFYDGAKSPWHASMIAKNKITVSIADAMLKPGAVARSLLARQPAVKEWLQHEYNYMLWQCQQGYGMYDRLQRVAKREEPVPLRVRVNSERVVTLGQYFIHASAAAGAPHYTLNIVSLKELVENVDAKRATTDTKDTFDVLNKHVFQDYLDGSIVNVLVVDTEPTAVTRDIDYVTVCGTHGWYILDNDWDDEDVQRVLYWHAMCNERF